MVHNLLVGSDADGGTLYADGILTGDAGMQNYYARLEAEKLRRDPRDARSRLPKEWLQDFDNHQ
jgi:hypothetical protein